MELEGIRSITTAEACDIFVRGVHGGKSGRFAYLYKEIRTCCIIAFLHHACRDVLRKSGLRAIGPAPLRTVRSMDTGMNVRPAILMAYHTLQTWTHSASSRLLSRDCSTPLSASSSWKSPKNTTSQRCAPRDRLSLTEQGKPISRIPEYTAPGGPNSYHCSKSPSHLSSCDLCLTRPVDTSWTQGFFPGLLWLLIERHRLLPSSIEPSYSEADLINLARRWQRDFEYLKRPSINHDQGFRFQLSFGRYVDEVG